MSKYSDAIGRSLVDATPAYLNDKGTFIAGKVVDRYYASGEYGRYPVLEIEAVEGTIALEAEGDTVAVNEGEVYAVHAFRQVAKQEVEDRDIQPGHEIVFACNGRRPSKTKGRNDMYLYKIVPVLSDKTEEPEDVPF